MNVLHALFLWLLVLSAQSQMRQIVIPDVSGVDEITFDPDRVSEENLRRWIVLSPLLNPDNGYGGPESIELCKSEDPRYTQCGGPQTSLNLNNARLNLESIRQRIADLDTVGRYPPELSPVVLYLKQLQTFWLWKETRKLEFFQTGKISELELPFDQNRSDGLDPKQQCGEVLDKIRAAKQSPNSEVIRTLVVTDWANCVWFAESRRIGPYPFNSWQRFLSAYGIKEHHVEDEVDD
ncbi:MAG: hypothetical protein ACR2IF_05320 [Terriglobales bacterium]